MLRNTEQKSWNGVWYLPGSSERHHGTLTYSPEDSFQLIIFSEGFESPFVELDVPPKIFKGSEQARVIGIRDKSQPYDAVYGEADGKEVTLLGVFDGGHTTKYSAGGESSEATYYPGLMLIGAHIPSKRAKILTRLDVSFDYLSYWLNDMGWLDVVLKTTEADPTYHEYFVRARVPGPPGPVAGLVINKEVALTIGFQGVLPSLSTSAYGFQARSRIEAFTKFVAIDEPVELDDFLAEVAKVEALLTICMDRPCKAHAFGCELEFEGRKRQVDLLVPRVGRVVPENERTHRMKELVRCSEENSFVDLFRKWFALYSRNPAIGVIGGFLNEASGQPLEPSVVMALALVESFHKTHVGKKSKDLLPETVKHSKKIGRWHDGKQATTFQRALDLYFRLPEAVQKELLPTPDCWAKALSDARNDISHEAVLKKRSGLEAFAAAKMAVSVVTIHLLMELNVSEQDILDLFQRSNSLAKARNLVQKHLLQSSEG
ncbi:ApeA N-terminal domain 1-containing protein [Corynebacterium sp. UMB8791]